MRTHLFIPDTQVKDGVLIDHIKALARFTVMKKPDVIIMIGDWWDMPSLSSYEDKGSKYFHDKSYRKDIDAGNKAMKLYMDIINAEIKRIQKNKKKSWKPEMHFCLGNHEDRISRAIRANPILEGTISLNDLYLDGWQVHGYLEIVEVDGILYSHYFVNPDSMTNNPVAGTIETKLKALGHSFSMGHQQRRQYGLRYTATGRELHGLVCGSFYMQDEQYLGPQKNRQHWRGVVVKHEVKNGSYDPMFVSLDYLVEKYL